MNIKQGEGSHSLRGQKERVTNQTARNKTQDLWLLFNMWVNTSLTHLVIIQESTAIINNMASVQQEIRKQLVTCKYDEEVQL